MSEKRPKQTNVAFEEMIQDAIEVFHERHFEEKIVTDEYSKMNDGLMPFSCTCFWAKQCTLTHRHVVQAYSDTSIKQQVPFSYDDKSDISAAKSPKNIYRKKKFFLKLLQLLQSVKLQR